MGSQQIAGSCPPVCSRSADTDRPVPLYRDAVQISALDLQDEGLGVIPAQSVFFVCLLWSLTCGLFSTRHGVWSPDGPQSRYRRDAVDA